MLSKEEFKQYKITFWEEFKQHMSKHRSASGRKMNWLQYRTDIKNIFLRLETNKSTVRVCFDIQFKDADIRAIVWEQMGEEGIWEEHYWNETISDFSRIYWEKTDLNYLNPEKRSAIFDFFEDKLIRFDKFYDVYKDILINLIK